MDPLNDDQDVFLDEIEKFMSDNNMTARDFGVSSGRGTAFVYRLQNGRRAYTTTRVGVRAWMEKFNRSRDIGDSSA